ncbi:MAG TPA: hypothetical protein VJ673_12285 [Aromatoleum sp.]|uniref:hypothetical protein n=1 Tax=Aromatoleum sp. TaxID=2307007 RepID=UPI002B459E22|nr:hypothetical protein [Aromatoleum sp.]HJV26457.1 hypothetical protein [Aromatoleum sp.]
MNKKILIAALAALLVNGCVVAPDGRGPAVVVAPPLPTIVEFDVEPYYYHRGYYYYYDNSRWRYASSRSGPWVELPRSHYPREVRYKGRGDGWRGDNDRDRDRRYERDDDRRWDRDRDHDRDKERDRRRKRDDDDDRRWDRDRDNDRGG